MTDWKSTACVLCSVNCGIRVMTGGDDGRQILKVRGDGDHPASAGYVCNKASRINYYQNPRDRLTTPLRRRGDGSYESIDWGTAIAEIAAKMAAIKGTYGGEKILYYGGGGQANHLPGLYARATASALGIKYRSNALAQEKTGEFWVADTMFGGWAHGDFHHCEVGLFIGKNPWQSHGIQRARTTVRDIAKDPKRTLIVIDPKRTETADLADIHLAVQPGRDVWLLAAIAAAIVQDGHVDETWLESHVEGAEAVLEHLSELPIGRYAALTGIDEATIRRVAEVIGQAESVAALEDLGVQMNRHSTLVSYTQRLLWLLTGNFGRPGTNYLPNGLGAIGRGTPGGTSPVTGARIIAGLIPCNSIAEEIVTDHPERFRAMIVESANPVHSLAQSDAFRQAMRSLECSVVIDVAMTETAREADYVLPTSTQYEKAECAFFNFEFPDNYFHLRKPLFPPLPGTLPEAEIHARLVEALGAMPGGAVERLEGALREGREAFRNEVFRALADDPGLFAVAPVVLYRTLGAALPEGMAQGAAVWALAHDFARRNEAAVQAAGHEGNGGALGDTLFDAMLEGTAVKFSSEDWEAVWQRVRRGEGKIRLDQPEMLAELAVVAAEVPNETSAEFPFVLSAGERRAFTANTVVRDPEWRRKDREGALFIHPDDARSLNLGDGSLARVHTARRSVEVQVALNDRMHPGHVSLPNGQGVDYPGVDGSLERVGISTNDLTSLEDRDKFVGTPWHKSVPVRIEAI